MSTTTDQAVFRVCYARLHELRSLAPNAKLLALTATATSETRKAIMEILLMDSSFIIYEALINPTLPILCFICQGIKSSEIF